MTKRHSLHLLRSFFIRGVFPVFLLSSLTPFDLHAGDEWGILVFSRTAGFRHGSIPTGIEAVKQLGREHGFRVDASEDSADFTPENLKRYRAVVFLNTTGTLFDEKQRKAFKAFIRAGGGYVGIHSAADTEYDWPWYGKLVGAYFKNHPRIQQAEIEVENRRHPSTAHLPDGRWVRSDEWYNFRENPRPNVNILLALDPETFEGSQMQGDHPIAWYHDYDGGRAWYTGGGHTNESFAEPGFLQHLLGGIRWAAGKAESGGTAKSRR